jgi:hypothetical protein
MDNLLLMFYLIAQTNPILFNFAILSFAAFIVSIVIIDEVWWAMMWGSNPRPRGK